MVQVKQVGVVVASVSVRVRDDLTDILTDKGTLGNGLESTHTPAHGLGSEHLQATRDALLDDTIAAVGPAVTCAVTFKNHGRIMVVEILIQSSITIVPAPEADGATDAIIAGTVIVALTRLHGRNGSIHVGRRCLTVVRDVRIVRRRLLVVQSIDDGNRMTLASLGNVSVQQSITHDLP